MWVLARPEGEERLQVVLHHWGGINCRNNTCINRLLCCYSFWGDSLWTFLSLVKEAGLLALAWLCEELVINVCWNCNLRDVNLNSDHRRK